MTDQNAYDPDDFVRRETIMLCEGMKFATYRVRNPTAEPGDVDEFSEPQHHMTWVPFEKIADRRSLVSIDKTVIMAMLDATATGELRRVLGMIEAEPEAWAKPRCVMTGSCAIYVYNQDTPERSMDVQVRRGAQVLALFGLETAKLFCKLAANEEGVAEAVYDRAG